MSRENYVKSQEIAMQPFEAILMGFMRVANTAELSVLKSLYPQIWKELKERYNAPGGYLKGELPDEFNESPKSFELPS